MSIANFYRERFQDKYEVLKHILALTDTEKWGGFYNYYIAFNESQKVFIKYIKQSSVSSITVFYDDEAISMIDEAWERFEAQDGELNAEKWTAISFHRAGLDFIQWRIENAETKSA
jgi:hypothetical protein